MKEAGIIHVLAVVILCRKKQWEFQRSLKQKRGKRDVIYLDRLRDVLEPHRKADNCFVFGADAPMTYKKAGVSAFQISLNRTGIDVLHTNSGTHLPRCALRPISQKKTAQGLLGHAQLSTTMDIYAELRDKKKRMEAAAALNAADF